MSARLGSTLVNYAQSRKAKRSHLCLCIKREREERAELRHRNWLITSRLYSPTENTKDLAMASGYASGITFFTFNGLKSNVYYRDVSTMVDESVIYTTCQVKKASGEGAVWIVYSEKNYGGVGSGNGLSHIVFPDVHGLVDPDFRIQSAQAFDVTQPCMCLFEHSKYRGNKLATGQSVEDITNQFTPGEVAGISSCIAHSGEWQLCTKPAFNGARRDVTGPENVPFLSELNDKVQSIKLLHAS